MTWSHSGLLEGPYYHGGTPGLSPGDRLTPHPALAHSTSVERAWTLAVDRQRNNFVFFTDHFPWALLYACWYKHRHQGTLGTVYEILPTGRIEPDTHERSTVLAASLDLGEKMPASCFRAPGAEIARVAAWSDGAYWYDGAGALLCRCSR